MGCRVRISVRGVPSLHLPLFGQPMTGASEGLSALGSRERWLTLLFVAVALFYRRPEALLQPQFWQEDGNIFFQGNYELGLRAVLVPYAGYLILLQRIIAAGRM